MDVEADGVVTSEYASTLSCGGMCLVSSRPLERNTEVHLRFRLTPDGPLVEAHLDPRTGQIEVLEIKKVVEKPLLRF